MKQTLRAAILVFMLACLAAQAGERRRTARPPASHEIVVAVGQESLISAKPDSPWLESVAVAMGPSSGIVLWTEGGTVRFARLASDGHPLDATGRVLLENGHSQRHVAIDAFRDQFVAAWCEVGGGKNRIVAVRLDGNGRAIDSTPLIVADNVGASEPEVGVTCSDAGCLVSWGGNLAYDSYATFSVGTVGARVLSSSAGAAGAPLVIAPRGIGNGIGTDHLNFCTAYAEPVTYGQSGPFVAKFLAADGTSSETELLSSTQVQIGTTWTAWNGSQWFVLMLDLSTTGGLSREFRFMRIDRSGRSVGGSTPVLLESEGVPVLCPFVADVFLYDPQSRRAVWDGTNFLVFTQHAIIPVGPDGRVAAGVAMDNYFPRSYAISVSSSGGGRTVVAYSRDSAVAIRAIDEVP